MSDVFPRWLLPGGLLSSLNGARAHRPRQHPLPSAAWPVHHDRAAGLQGTFNAQALAALVPGNSSTGASRRHGYGQLTGKGADSAPRSEFTSVHYFAVSFHHRSAMKLSLREGAVCRHFPPPTPLPCQASDVRLLTTTRFPPSSLRPPSEIAKLRPLDFPAEP